MSGHKMCMRQNVWTQNVYAPECVDTKCVCARMCGRARLCGHNMCMRQNVWTQNVYVSECVDTKCACVRMCGHKMSMHNIILSD